MIALALACCLSTTTPVADNAAQVLAALAAVPAASDSAAVAACLEILMRDPLSSARTLIGELRLVREGRIVASEWRKHRRAMRAIWAVRGLRYVTGGLEFRAETGHRWGAEERDRQHFLYLMDKQQVPFFSVRMSTDVVYLAPADAQKVVIKRWKRWKEWMEKQGATFPFKTAERLEDWYL